MKYLCRDNEKIIDKVLEEDMYMEMKKIKENNKKMLKQDP